MADLFEPFLAEPARAAILTDFDGTLAPIVDDPLAARPLPGAVDVLHRLAERFGVVGVVSGRPLDFLVGHLGDDVGDLPAFDGLDRLAAAGVHTVKVAVVTSEAPALLLERADLVVEGPAGALTLFEGLADG